MERLKKLPHRGGGGRGGGGDSKIKNKTKGHT